MLRTAHIVVAAGATQPLLAAGKWFRLQRVSSAGAGPYLTAKVLEPSAHGGKQMADQLSVYDGDLFGWDDRGFELIYWTNPTANDIAADVLVATEGRHEIARVLIDNFPPVGGSALLSTADVVVAAASAVPQLLIAANTARRGVTIGSLASNPPGAIPLRIGDNLITATRGAQLGVGGEHTFDTTGAIYAWNPDPALAQTVTVVELLD